MAARAKNRKGLFGYFFSRLSFHFSFSLSRGRSGSAWGWVNFQCRGVLLIWIRVGQGPTALAVGAGGGCLDIFSLVYQGVVGWCDGAG